MLFSNQRPVFHLLTIRGAGLCSGMMLLRGNIFRKSSDSRITHASLIKYYTQIIQACVHAQLHKHLLTPRSFCSAFRGSVKKHEVLWLSSNFPLTHTVISPSVTLRLLTNTAAELHRAGVREGIRGLDDSPNYRCLHHAHMTSLKCHPAKHTDTRTHIFCPHNIRLWCDAGRAHVTQDWSNSNAGSCTRDGLAGCQFTCPNIHTVDHLMLCNCVLVHWR